MPPARAIGGQTEQSAWREAPKLRGGGRSIESRNFAHIFSSARKAGDGPKFAANFIQRRGHPNFEKNVSKLWPGPTRGPQFVCGGHLYYLCLKSCTRGLSNFIFIFEII